MSLKCKYCERTFTETMNGLTERTFHELQNPAEIINCKN